MEVNDLLIVVGLSTTLTTAVTVVSTYRMIQATREEFCKKWEAIAIRLGIVEHDHEKEK